MVDLALQITLVVLLLLTITWCVIVHHRLRRLRADRGEMAAFIEALGEATARAEAAVHQMHEANRAVEVTGQEQQLRARQRGEDLARLMANAARVIERLDTAVEQGATRVATLRTRPAEAAPAPDARNMTAGQPGEARRRPVPIVERGGRAAPADQRATLAPAAAAVAAVAAEPARTGQALSPVRREGQLGGLLHGELLEALEGLR